MPFIMSKPLVAAAAPTAERWAVFLIGKPVSTSDWIEIAEIEMALSSGGADECSGGSVTNSAGWTNPANAFDNNTSNYANYVLSRGTKPYMGYVFGSAKAITHVRLRASTTPANMVTAFVVGYSTDGGSTWAYSDVITSFSAWSSGEEREFTLSFGASYSQSTALIWGVSTDGKEIEELEFRATSGGADLATGGGFLVDEAVNGSVAGLHVFSGTGDLWWPAGSSAYVQYVWATAQNPTYVAIRGSSTFGTPPAAIDVWWSPDGQTRNIVFSQTGITGYTNGVFKEFGPF